LASMGRKKDAAGVYNSAIAQLGQWQAVGHDRMLKKQGQIAGCRLRMGDILFQLKDFKGALANYLAAYHKLDAADGAWAIFQIANAYKQMGDQKRAVEFYGRLKTEYPDNYWLEQLSRNDNAAALERKTEVPVP